VFDQYGNLAMPVNANPVNLPWPSPVNVGPGRQLQRGTPYPQTWMHQTLGGLGQGNFEMMAQVGVSLAVQYGLNLFALWGVAKMLKIKVTPKQLFLGAGLFQGINMVGSVMASQVMSRFLTGPPE